MIKVDFHIHTVSTDKDDDFEFDISKLKSYIKETDLSAIAITNHNIFSLTNYDTILENIAIEDCVIFPGIEIDYNNGHILIISERDDVSVKEFNKKCKKIEDYFKEDSEKKYVTKEELIDAFGDLDSYLVIPHYKKDKRDLTIEQIKILDDKINWGEVGNPKKFIRSKKDSNSLTPLLFSDFRISKDQIESKDKHNQTKLFPNRHTYIDLNFDDLSIKKIKICFSSKDRVFLNPDNNDDYFYALNDKVKIVDGLNVVIGTRSSGKSFLLENINKSSKTKNSKDLKYLKQFQIINESNQDRIIDTLKLKVEDKIKSYTTELEEYINLISNIDLDFNEEELNQYTTSLLKHSTETKLRDIYSKCSLFNSPDLIDLNTNETQELIEAIYKLLNNTKHKQTIYKHLSVENLINLSEELLEIFKLEQIENSIIIEANSISKKISKDLQIESSVTAIKPYDIKKHFINLKKILSFDNFITNYNHKSIIDYRDYNNKYFQTTYLEKNMSVDQVLESTKYTPKNHFKNTVSENNKLINEPYKYLRSIIKDDKIDLIKLNLYKVFFISNTDIVDKRGSQLSGGQRAELNLLNHLEDAKKNDILLIDELEPSFDNIYINNELIDIIKRISKDTIVVLSTHNNSLGVLLEPDNLIYTDFVFDEKINKNIYYQYYGHYNGDILLTKDGNKINTKDIYIDMMEGGTEPYKKRGIIYESFNNK